ncbi:uncharacterized protein LOC110893503 [Helianthus annuus]|uniref:uncharacterized protein LOC110893503 n=1 Tax=Helianthus annuus TaxID=4232 RepID=UPI000B8F4C50|nr:uncharacterized protein LOC110893503 [Helianthus annuus]
MRIKTDLTIRIHEAQQEAVKLENSRARSLCGMEVKLVPKENGTLYFMERIWAPSLGNLRALILVEAHKSRYLIRPGSDKMYPDLKDWYWWPKMKADIYVYVGNCLTCAKIKAEYPNPSGLLQQHEVSVWK